jgi:pimeloyl-ACP methyl ester carboxylesterase
MPFLEANGVTLHYQDTGGDGPPILFSHGLLWSGEMFAAQIAALRATHRCICYDHRGQGRSPPSPTHYDMDALSADAVALIEKLQLGPVHFVGLSMGGFVGMRLASRRPELIKSLVLIDTAADPEPPLNIPKYKVMSLLARVLGYRMLVPRIMKIMFAPAFRNDPARAALRRNMEDHLAQLRDAETRAALQSVTSRKPIHGELSRIQAPTLVLHGSDDTAIKIPRARAMAEGIPGSRFVLIPRAGHTSTVEEPAAISAVLTEFFA